MKSLDVRLIFILLELTQEPRRVKNHLFSFARPFSSEIWVFVAFSYVCVSLTMWMVARFSPFEWELSSPNKIQELYVTDCECNSGGASSHLHRCTSVEDDKDQHVITAKRQTIETICAHNNFNHFQYSTSTLTLAMCNDETCLHKQHAEDYFNSHMYRNSYYMKNFHDNSMTTHETDEIAFEHDDDGMFCDELNLEHSATITPRSRDILLADEHEHGLTDALTDDDSISSNEIELTTFHNDFTFYNSFWYMIGTLMQGSDLHPKVSFHFYYFFI